MLTNWGAGTHAQVAMGVEMDPSAIAARDHMKLLLLVRAYQVKSQ